MFTTMNPVLRADLENLESRIKPLENAKGSDHENIAYAICGLTRDIRFRLGCPERESSKLVQEVVELFRRAASAIRPNEGDEMLAAYQFNINERARMIEERATPGDTAEFSI